MDIRQMAIAATMAAVAAAAADNLVTNGGFEADADGNVAGWETVGGKYSFSPDGGINGTGALRYDAASTNAAAAPEQKLHLHPRRRYKFSAWIRTDGLNGKGRGATIRMEWFRKGGRLFDWGYADDSLKRTNMWTKIECVTPPMPPEAVDFSVRLLVEGVKEGSAWFDNVCVTPLPQTAFEGLVSTAYRGVAADGEVVFRPLVAPEWEGALPPERVFLNYLDADGKAQTKAADADISFTLPVEGLKRGTQKVLVAAQDGAGELLGTAEMEFTRVEALPERAVWFDAQGRAIVDGKPFFPLGMYASGISSNELAIFADGPFNCIMPYGPPKTTEIMDLCLTNGIRVIYSLKDAYYAKGREKEELEFVEKTVAQFKDHPALLAWYVADEPPLSKLPRYKARCDLLARLDPGHPCWAVYYQYDLIQQYMPAFDVVGTDPYPIPDWPFSMAVKWTRFARRGTRGCKPLWQVPQSFSFSCYGKKPGSGVMHEVRSPTEGELRSMCWQCIAGGANGLVLYSWFDMRREKSDRPFDDRWAECRRVVSEIKKYVPVLLDDELPSYATAIADKGEPPPFGGVEARAWRHGGETWLLVVNSESEPVEAEVTLAEAVRGAAAEFGPEAKLDDGGQRVRLSLGALEPAFIRLSPGR